MLVRGGDGAIRCVSKPIPGWLVSLLMRGRLGPMKLGPEDQASIEFGDRCRAWALEGRLKGTFTKIPHEVGAVSKKDGKFRVAQARYAKQIAMGMITGSADYAFIWDDGGGWIEMKSKTGTLTPEQKAFRDWCKREGTRWARARSADEAEAVLFEWGVLT